MANITGVNPPVLNDQDYVDKNKNSIDAIDAHDHTIGKGVQIPTGGIVDLAVTNAKVATGIDAAKLADGTVSNTEFQYLNGVTGGIQGQLDAKASTTSLTDHINDATAAHAASAVSFSAVGTIAATDAQTAIAEVATDAASALSTHEADTSTHGVSEIVGRTEVQTLTNKTLTSPSITTPTGIVKADVGLGNVDNTSDATKNSASVTLTNKTLTAPVIDNAQMTEGAAPATPSAGTLKVYAKTDSKLYTLNSAGTEAQVGAGAGGGSINYISSNPDAESATTGWATYKDAAASTPADGTGGSPTLTFTRTTSSPLRGTASFLITTTAANLQGEGASFDFTVPAGDFAKPISISFDYNIASGTYVTGDMTVYIYDVTNSTLIQPAGYQIQAMGSTLANKHIATFQTSATGTSYRLIFHRAVSTASAMTIKIDNVQVGPQIVQYGAPVTDWQSYTPTISAWASGVGTVSGQWRRVGDSMEISATIPLTGAVSGNLTSVSIPSGFTIDTAKIAGYSAGTNYIGQATVKAAGSANYIANVAVAGTTGIVPYVFSTSGSYGGIDASITATVPGTFANGDYVKINAKVPITGWSSTVVMSQDTDTRVVACWAFRNATANIAPNGSTIKIPLNAVATNQDTHAAFDTTNNRYVIQVPGWYDITGVVEIASTNVLANLYLARIFKNGGACLDGELETAVVTTSFTRSVSGSGYFNAGDYLELHLYGAGNNSASQLTVNAGQATTRLHISRLSGPSAIAASETVACSAYRAGSNQTITAGVDTDVIFNTIEDSSHGTGAFNTSTGVFTAPVSGRYSFSWLLSVAIGATAPSDIEIRVRKNGASSYAYWNWNSFTVSKNYSWCSSGYVKMLAGDTLSVTVTSTSQNITIKNTGGANHVTTFYIVRSGNY
jgi:hypothetical protein